MPKCRCVFGWTRRTYRFPGPVGLGNRRGLAAVVAVVVSLLVAPGAVAAPDRTGLEPGTAGGPCAGVYEVVVHGNRHSCAHPDTPPHGVDPKTRDPLSDPAAATAAGTTSGSTTAASSAAVPCYGDGQSGNRVEAVYAYPSGSTDRYSQAVASIATWAAAADQVFANSAAETGGVRHIRFVTDASCNLVIDHVAIPASSVSDFAQSESALAQLGLNRTDRKYLVWMDANVYCGIADVMRDDSAAQTNASNGGRAEYARVDNGCWGVAGQSVEAHELMHTLGGVQVSAPHATPAYHCYDESDRMCYADGSGVAMQQVCATSHENLFDCNHNDYFSTAPVAGTYLATHWNTANSTFLATADPVATTTANGGRFTSLTPARILDTRTGTGGFSAPIGPGQSISVQGTGVGGVPATGVSAVMLNVTVTQPTAAGYLTIYPTGVALPLAANLNFGPGQTVGNMVVAKVGTGGKFSIYNSSGSTHVVVDVSGWYSDGTGTAFAGGQYTALSPARVLDTRTGTGGILGALTGGSLLNLTVTGVGGVPSTGVSAVLLNVAVTQPTLMSYLTIFPTAAAMPLASSLNFVGGETVSNMVIAKVGSGGQISIFNAVGLTQIVADVNGWFTDGTGTAPAGGLVSAVTPSRILDTRNGTGGFSAPVGPAQSINVPVIGVGGVPSTGVSAVMLNVAVTSPTADSWLTVYPTGTTMPLAANLNFPAGGTVPNLVMAKVGPGGTVSIYNAAGSVQIIADVAGWVS